MCVFYYALIYTIMAGCQGEREKIGGQKTEERKQEGEKIRR